MRNYLIIKLLYFSHYRGHLHPLVLPPFVCYNELACEFKALGVDSIICMSVNDTFVMNAWKADQECENVIVIPDGNGEFTEGMGMLVGKEDLGFGKRSWRYSMLVRNGIVEKMFVEPQEPGDPFKVSDADTMIKYLKPEWQAKPSVSVITKPGCPYCAKAKALLKAKDYTFEEIVLGRDASTISVRAITGKQAYLKSLSVENTSVVVKS